MADIYEKIYKKYSIDISQENIFKLYKIESYDINEVDLQACIEATRKRWNQSINGANEKNAERDRLRLEKADKYESILKDEKLRKELFQFYNSSNNSNKDSQKSSSDLEFAKEYFELLSTSKKIRKKDVEFFFEYYQDERKKKKAILEMLNKEYKVIGLGNEDKYSEDDEGSEKKRKNSNSSLIMNLFQEDTILKLNKCNRFYVEAQKSSELRLKYSSLSETLYNFIGLEKITKFEDFENLISEKSKEVFQLRQEKGAEYIPLVDLFNTLQVLTTHKDVVDNFDEFKIIIKYSQLTPYMFSFTEFKPNTLKGLLNIAKKEYAFRDETDFILNYFLPLHDNFGISDSGISSIVKKAKKKANANKVLNKIDSKLKFGQKRKLPVWATILHTLVYFPIFILYIVFEITKAIFTEIHRFAIPTFVSVFVIENFLLSTSNIGSVLVLVKIFNKNDWLSFLSSFFGEIIYGTFEFIMFSILFILLLFIVYTIPGLLISSLVKYFSFYINKGFDWRGYERNFQNFFKTLLLKTENKFIAHKKSFVKDYLKRLGINVLSIVLIISIFIFVPIGFDKFSESTGYFQNDDAIVTLIDNSYAEVIEIADVYDTANRDNVITSFEKGETVYFTGNEETSWDDSKLYEIYVNDEQSILGWIEAENIEVRSMGE